jgi:hypothetical protein
MKRERMDRVTAEPEWAESGQKKGTQLRVPKCGVEVCVLLLDLAGPRVGSWGGVISTQTWPGGLETNDLWGFLFSAVSFESATSCISNHHANTNHPFLGWDRRAQENTITSNTLEKGVWWVKRSGFDRAVWRNHWD